MPPEMIVDNCAPVLAGIKTANLFSASYEQYEDAKKDVRELNHQLGEKGIRVVPLSYRENRVLFYVYRPNYLHRDLQNRMAVNVLRKKGYRVDNADLAVAQLAVRLKNWAGTFPHEIGFFLGYPPEDVVGFIRHGARDAKVTGFWKVYGDVGKAEKLFASYRRCTDSYRRQLKKGIQITQLAVKETKAENGNNH